MLPNRFPDRGEAPEYNTVDAALWYVEAVRAYIAYTGDHALVRERLFPSFATLSTGIFAVRATGFRRITTVY
jgi:glycogen debranching enzyme